MSMQKIVSGYCPLSRQQFFSDNYKDIHNFPHIFISFMLHKINLNYKTAVKSNTF